MPDILHRVIIEALPAQVFSALTTQQGLSDWWTRAAISPDNIVSFMFGPNGEHVVKMAVEQLVPDKKVVWRCVEGPWVDIGEFVYDIIEDERGSVVLFSHTGWQKADDFYRHCNSKWGFFLATSLKELLETGTGKPHPADPDI